MSLFSRVFKKAGASSRQEPLIDLEGRLRRVYVLTEELRADPTQVELARALTLDKSRPNMGLRGEHGLFASEQWWRSINAGKIPIRRVSGVIVRAYVAGQDCGGRANTIEVALREGGHTSVGIYVNDRRDVYLFRPGCRIELIYALDRLKVDHGSGPYAEVALEMAISEASILTGSSSEA